MCNREAELVVEGAFLDGHGGHSLRAAEPNTHHSSVLLPERKGRVDEAQNRDDGHVHSLGAGQCRANHVSLLQNGVDQVLLAPTSTLRVSPTGPNSPPVRSTETSAFLYRFASMT